MYVVTTNLGMTHTYMYLRQSTRTTCSRLVTLYLRIYLYFFSNNI